MIVDSFNRKLPKNAFIIRHTEVGDFLQCQRKWYFTSHNGLNLEPKLRNDKLRIGTVWHKALEAYYLASMDSAVKNPLNKAQEAMAKALEDDKHELELVLGDEFYTDEVKSKQAKDEEMLYSVLESYPEWANNEADPPDRELGIKRVENRFIVPVYNPDTGKRTQAYLATKTDAIAERNQWLWIIEHKTRGASDKVNDPTGLGIDLQVGLQNMALQQWLTETRTPRNVRGVVYNLARKQKPGPRVKNPIYGRHKLMRDQSELDHMSKFLHMVYRSMRRASAKKEDDWEKAVFMHYNPQVFGSGYCIWGCPVREICEGLNRGDDIDYLISVHLKPREKDIWQTLEEEMNEE